MSIELTSLQEASDRREDALIASVKMLFNSTINKEKVILIVEGKDDKDVYSLCLKANAVCIFPDGNCMKHAIILEALNVMYRNRLLAIKDADFDRLEGRNNPFENLLLTDTHDMEGMVLSNGIPMLIGDDEERCHCIDLNIIYKELVDVSYLKWYNHVHNLGLNFRNIALDLDLNDYLCAVMANTANEVSVTLNDVLAFKNCNAHVSMKELCNGHDLFERIYILAHNVKRGNFAKRPFFCRLRKSYTIDKFSKTALYRSIKEWENTNEQSILAG